jgi:glycosyltransferase involved in cell wall biosynthesis
MAIIATRRPEKILCIDQYSKVGGGQRSLLDLLPTFSERGWSPSVAAPGGGPFERLLQSSGYRTYSIECGEYSIKEKSLSESLRYAAEQPQLAKALYRAFSHHESTLLYVNGPRVLPAAALIARRTGIPIVFHCHNRLLQASAITLTGSALRWAKAHVIACCHYAAQPLTAHVLPERISVVFNGVENMATKGFRGGKIRRIGVVGRVEMEKGQLLFVEAARTIVEKVKDCSFVVAGVPMFSNEAYYRHVKESSRGLPLEFLGWRENIAKVYSELDLLVVPSSALEATTRVILEAYSAGLPVVAFPSGGILEILKNNETGFLTEEPTAESLARRVLSIIDMDDHTVEAVVRRARIMWSERFTLNAYRDSVCGALRRAVSFSEGQPATLASAGARTD